MTDQEGRMFVRCPSCSHGFDILEVTLGVKATVVCPACARVVVIRAATAHTDDATVPFDPGTMAAVEEATDLAGGRSTLALPKGKRVSLATLAGPRKGDVFPFTTPRLLIGRAGGGAGAEVELADADVSRKHATVECHGTRVVLQDLASTNGTFVGEERIDSRELQDGDEFRVGLSRFLLIVAAD